MDLATQSNSRWEVMWVVVKNGEKRIICKEFDHDFVSAVGLYVKVKQAGKKMCTLRCCNVAYSPPESYRDVEPIYGKKKGKVIVIGERLTEPPSFSHKMDRLNDQGVWWCPYCMQLRRFEKRAWYELDDRMVADDPKYYCPMCDISHSDRNVQKYNPIAQNLMNRKKSRGRNKKSGRRRRK